MCLITFAWRPQHARPLIVVANRDEFYARPTAPLANGRMHLVSTQAEISKRGEPG